MNTRRKVTVGFGIGILLMVIAFNFSQAGAFTSTWAVNVGDSWRWRISKAIWDDFDTEHTWVGRSATINVTAKGNDTTYTWIRGDVKFYDENGTLEDSEDNVTLGNAFINCPDSSNSCLTLYIAANGTAFVVPVIIPLPVANYLEMYALFLNMSLHDLWEQLPNDIPFTIEDDFNVSTTGSDISVTFYISGTLSGYTVSHQPVEVELSFDSNGVATRLLATAVDVPVTGSITTDILFFEIVREDVNPSSDIPGYDVAIIAGMLIIGVSLIVLQINRKRN